MKKNLKRSVGEPRMFVTITEGDRIVFEGLFRNVEWKLERDIRRVRNESGKVVRMVPVKNSETLTVRAKA